MARSSLAWAAAEDVFLLVLAKLEEGVFWVWGEWVGRSLGWTSLPLGWVAVELEGEALPRKTGGSSIREEDQTSFLSREE